MPGSGFSQASDLRGCTWNRLRKRILTLVLFFFPVLAPYTVPTMAGAEPLPRTPPGMIRDVRSGITRLRTGHRAALKSYLSLARYYRRRGLPLKAAELYVFGLARAPGDPRFLRGIAEVFSRAGRYEEAERYAERLVAVLPDDPQARSLLRRIRSAAESRRNRDKGRAGRKESGGSGLKGTKQEKGSKKPQGGSKNGAGHGKDGRTSGESTVQRGDGGKDRRDKKAEKPGRWELLRALRLMKALKAALRLYTATHADDKAVKEGKVDIELLRKDGVLPASLSLSPWEKKIRLAGGKVSIEGLGDPERLEKELAPFRTDLERYERFLLAGELAEAADVAAEMAARYPDEKELLFRRLFTLLALRRGKEAVKAGRRLARRFASSPRTLFELLMAQYRSHSFPAARDTATLLARRFPGTNWADMAGQILQLVDRNIDFDLLSTLVDARKSFLHSRAEQNTSTGAVRGATGR